MAIVEHELVIGGDDIPEDSWVPCDYCDNAGMVVDNATEELTDCPRCGGLAFVFVEGPGLDEWEPGDDDEEC